MTRPLWTLAEIVAASGGRLDGREQRQTPGPGASMSPQGRGQASAITTAISGISIDTRSLAAGDLFVPLTDARDGHEFVTAAFERGAIAALVREDYVRRPGDGPLIRVAEPLRALEHIGIAARARLASSARVIAVTGSAGKTGTKEMLRACLKVCASSPDRVHAPEKSFNNHWGVPLTLARMPADTELAVFEIGMNHAGEIRPLTKMVRPHIAIVTNVLPVHVGNFPDGEIGVANAKSEIFEGLEAPPSESSGEVSALQSQRAGPGSFYAAEQAQGGEGPGSSRRQKPSLRPGPQSVDGEQEPRRGTAIILRDSAHFVRLSDAAERHGAKVLSFGRARDCEARLTNLEIGTSARQDLASATAILKGREISYALGLIGRHLATNSLAVLAALDVVGCDVVRASRALAGVSSAPGRGARVRFAGAGAPAILLDESYNANPASMAAALASLAQITDEAVRRKVAILGDMLELGQQSVGYHTGLLPHAVRADLVFCSGPNMRHLYDLLPAERQGAWAATSAELIEPVLAALRPGDAVMVKGSLGSRMAPIVEAIKKRFADGSKGG